MLLFRELSEGMVRNPVDMFRRYGPCKSEMISADSRRSAFCTMRVVEQLISRSYGCVGRFNSGIDCVSDVSDVSAESAVSRVWKESN